MQDLADTQDTPASALVVAPDGLGVSWIAQLVPFHVWASVAVPPLVKEVPTAVQVVRHGHDTLLNQLLSA